MKVFTPNGNKPFWLQYDADLKKVQFWLAATKLMYDNLQVSKEENTTKSRDGFVQVAASLLRRWSDIFHDQPLEGVIGGIVTQPLPTASSCAWT